MVWTRENLGSASIYDKTQIDWVLASARFSDEDRAAGYNGESIKDYLNRFDQYKKAKDERPDLNSPTPPIPAFAWIVQVSPSGWSELILSAEPVCPTLIYNPPNHPDLTEGKIGIRLYPGNDEFFYCLPGDITPNRKKLTNRTSADGVQGDFVKYAYLSSSPGHEIPGVFIRVT